MNTKTRDKHSTDPESAPSPLAGEAVGDSWLLPLVDAALGQVVGRNVVSSIEVVDLLLDLRSRIVLENAWLAATQDQSKKGR